MPDTALPASSPPLIAGTIPLIDVADYLAGKPGAADEAAAKLRWAFEKVGFYYLAGHGVPQALIDSTYEQASRFHDLPLAAKEALKVDEHNIGYLPVQRAPAGSPNAHRQPSQNEAYFLRRERTPDDPAVRENRRFHAMNKWPSADDLPGFRDATLAYIRTMEQLGLRLVPLYARALGLPDDFFAPAFRSPHLILRMSRYRSIAGEDGAESLVPHTDSGFMTLLPPNPVQGLAIQLPEGRWLDAPHVPGAYVVNGGDMLHRWTNERFLSTPHRVRNVSSGLRHAIPFFFDPGHEAMIECIPNAGPPKYPPIRMGDYAVWFASKSYAHMEKVETPPLEQIAPGARATMRWRD
ncbi:MAG: 2-oxoglutarate and iron-dependent oxygenase domain-containing protein [Reyranellaceae bacterium]